VKNPFELGLDATWPIPFEVRVLVNTLILENGGRIKTGFFVP
jgi:hypothetical protein